MHLLDMERTDRSAVPQVQYTEHNVRYGATYREARPPVCARGFFSICPFFPNRHRDLHDSPCTVENP